MKMENEIEFDKEKVAVMHKISRELLTDIEFGCGNTDMDVELNLMTLQLSGHIYSNMADTRTLTYYCDKPTFFDWLFRRRKTVRWELKVKDLLLNPPKLKDRTTRIYITEKIEE